MSSASAPKRSRSSPSSICREKSLPISQQMVPRFTHLKKIGKFKPIPQPSLLIRLKIVHPRRQKRKCPRICPLQSAAAENPGHPMAMTEKTAGRLSSAQCSKRTALVPLFPITLGIWREHFPRCVSPMFRKRRSILTLRRTTKTDCAAISTRQQCEMTWRRATSSARTMNQSP